LIALNGTIFIVTYLPLKLTAISPNTGAFDKRDNNLIQFVGKTNVFTTHINSTQITNATTQQEIHKPSNPKSPQEVQTEKEQIQKSNSNITVFTQTLLAGKVYGDL
jgi:hypothetical protein